jgi:CheY-like chemotaxis protein
MSSTHIPSHPGAGNVTGGKEHLPGPESGQRGKLLLVDDDPMTGMVLGGWLRLKGYQTTFVATAAEADRLLATATFDLVLSDIRMPGNFHLEWVQQLLSNDTTPPVLLITGTPELETALRAANLPVAGYLLKPVDFTTLDDVIQRIVQEHRRRCEFISVIEDIIKMLSTPGNHAAEEEKHIVERLQHLSTGFRTRVGRVAVGQVDTGAWRSAVTDSIAVIEKTKHSFRSKELGALRQRLQEMLARTEVA